MNLQSPLAEQLSAYINFRRAVGFCSEDAFFFLETFDRFLVAKNHSGPLTEEMVLEFANLNPNTTVDYRARRYQVVRHFSEYLATFDPDTPRLDPKALERSKIRAPRHIYTDQELETLLHEARHISPKIPLYGLTLQTAIGLAASSGLRISEIVRLDKADADLKTGVLNIRNSKFNKSRLVPVHDTTRTVLHDYAAARDSVFPAPKTPAFFVNRLGKRFVRNTLQQAFTRVARRARLRPPKGRGPSFHDLRRRFATRRLLLWYESGIDVGGMLPVLATYMGHAHYSDTAYYLTATADLLALAGERLERWIQEAQ